MADKFELVADVHATKPLRFVVKGPALNEYGIWRVFDPYGLHVGTYNSPVEAIAMAMRLTHQRTGRYDFADDR